MDLEILNPEQRVGRRFLGIDRLRDYVDVQRYWVRVVAENSVAIGAGLESAGKRVDFGFGN